MAEGLNKVQLIGHLGRAPDLKYAQSGTAIVNFSIATAERRKEGGDWTEFTEWHQVVVFGKTAEACNRYLDKGSQVYVEGKLQTRKWQDRDGNDRKTTEVVANRVLFLGGRGNGNQGGGRRNDGPPPDDGLPPDTRTTDDDEIPF